MRDENKNLLPDLASERFQLDLSATPVNYIFDQPHALRRPANATATNFVPALAAFDAENAVIWGNEPLLQALERGKRTQHMLCDEDIETLAHEFARALQYKDIFEENLSQSRRIEALRRRRSQVVTRSTVESYMNYTLLLEREAEELVQRVRMEILSSFDRAQHGSGLSSTAINNKAEELADDLIRDMRRDFGSWAKREFARLNHSDIDDSGPTDGVDDAANEVTCRVFQMRKLRRLFPLKQSATLADLVDQIVKFKIPIVVPVSNQRDH